MFDYQRFSKCVERGDVVAQLIFKLVLPFCFSSLNSNVTKYLQFRGWSCNLATTSIFAVIGTDIIKDHYTFYNTKYLK